MANIAKHDTEKEGECDSCEYSRIDLLVARYTIGVSNFLSDHSVAICIERCWWFG